MPGDSGAWIYDPVQRQLCGHVLAWADKSKIAYIAPMEVLFDDIRRTLNASRITLQPEGTPVAETGTLSEYEEQEGCHAKSNDQITMARDIELALEQLDISTQGQVDRQTPGDPAHKLSTRSTTRSRGSTTLTAAPRSTTAAARKDVPMVGPAGPTTRRDRFALLV